MKKILKDKVLAGDVGTKEEEKIVGVLDEIYGDKEILACETYSDQVTLTNFKLWKRLFAPSKVEPPNLIYLDQEDLVIKLILNHHLSEDTVISHILFDPAYDELIFKYFEGIMGAFSREKRLGSYLFWAIDKKNNHRVQLWKEGNCLVSEDGEFRVELNAENLCTLLFNRDLVPSMMLIFMVLCFYYGLKCLGGFNQVNYLTFMKNAYIKMQVDRGNYKSIEVCARAQTKELGGDGTTIAFLGGPGGELVPAFGLDLILYGEENTWPQVVEGARKILLEEALTPMMPELYKVVYSEADREAELGSLTSERKLPN